MQTNYSNRQTYDAAAELLAMFGDSASDIAVARARASRDCGNVQTFCHWRQVARLIDALAAKRPSGTVH